MRHSSWKLSRKFPPSSGRSPVSGVQATDLELSGRYTELCCIGQSALQETRFPAADAAFDDVTLDLVEDELGRD